MFYAMLFVRLCYSWGYVIVGHAIFRLFYSFQLCYLFGYVLFNVILLVLSCYFFGYVTSSVMWFLGICFKVMLLFILCCLFVCFCLLWFCYVLFKWCYCLCYVIFLYYVIIWGEVTFLGYASFFVMIYLHVLNFLLCYFLDDVISWLYYFLGYVMF